MKRKPICCFVGEKPQKFPWGYDEKWPDCIRLKEKLAFEIETMRQKGVKSFMSNMAMGVELWAAEIVVSLKQDYPHGEIKLYAAIPFEGQANRWSPDFRERYYNVLTKADEETVLQAHYTKGCICACSRYMVENSTHMIAVCNGGEAGSTKYSVEYAVSRGLEVVVINPKDVSCYEMPRLRNFKPIK